MATQRGFTLLELIIALMISGLLLALLYSGLSNSLQQWQSIDRISQANSQQYLLLQHLRQQLMRAIEVREDNLLVRFNGTDQGLSFIAPLELEQSGGGLYRYNLVQITDEFESRLQLQIQPYRPASDKETEQPIAIETLELYRGPHRFQLAYAEKGPEGTLLWLSDWHQQPQLPVAVHMKVHAPASGLRQWPDFLVRIREPEYVR